MTRLDGCAFFSASNFPGQKPAFDQKGSAVGRGENDVPKMERVFDKSYIIEYVTFQEIVTVLLRIIYRYITKKVTL